MAKRAQDAKKRAEQKARDEAALKEKLAAAEARMKAAEAKHHPWIQFKPKPGCPPAAKANTANFQYLKTLVRVKLGLVKLV